jgi:hypothetical protein
MPLGHLAGNCRSLGSSENFLQSEKSRHLLSSAMPAAELSAARKKAARGALEGAPRGQPQAARRMWRSRLHDSSKDG